MSAPRSASRTRAGDLQRLETEFAVLVRRVRRTLWDRARAVHPDLQPATYLLLAHLGRVGPVRAAAVVEEMGVDKAAVSRQLHHLHELGLVRRSPDPHDRRATLVELTEQSRRVLAQVHDEGRRRLHERLADWDDDDLTAFVDGLARYNAAVTD